MVDGRQGMLRNGETMTPKSLVIPTRIEVSGLTCAQKIHVSLPRNAGSVPTQFSGFAWFSLISVGFPDLPAMGCLNCVTRSWELVDDQNSSMSSDHLQ